MKKNCNEKKIILAAGGTGGHIFPAVAVAEVMMNQNYKVLFITDGNFKKFQKLFKNVVNRVNFKVTYINSRYRSGFIGRILMGFEAISNALCLFGKIIKFGGGGVVGFGSYVSLSAVMAGFLARKKIILHEQNVVLGLGNRISIFFASSCLCGFPELKKVPLLNKKKIIYSGVPIRDNFSKNRSLRFGLSMNDYSSFEIKNDIKILILGGSQGAKSFGKIIPPAIELLPEDIKKRITIYHQAPSKCIESIVSRYKKIGISAKVRSFFSNVAELMSCGHIMIGRAGASTISEIQCLGVPNILIPYPTSADDHQLQNALYMQKKGGSVVMEEKNLTPFRLSKTIEFLLSEEELSKISKCAKKAWSPYSNFRVASLIESLIYKKKHNSFAFFDLNFYLDKICIN